MAIYMVTNLLEARSYIADELAQGKTLANLVRDRVDFLQGQFYFEKSQRVDQTELDFRSGNLPSSGKEEMVLARLIKSFIQEPNCAVLLQETQMDPSELPGWEYASLAAFYDGEIYWRIEGQKLATRSDDEMLKIVRSASFYPFSAFFYINKSQNEKTKLEYDDLEEIVNTLIAVAVGAFDDRSFLIWWRDGSVPFPLPVG